MIINHNLSAMNANRQLGKNTNAISKSIEKLSSGYRINKAADDAAGLSISEKMRGQIRGLNKASDNAADGISMVQTAEGGLNETQNILQRMRELATQAANDTNVTADRDAINDEMKQLSDEITRIGQQTQFNTKNILNAGAADNTVGNGAINVNIQVGANCGQSISVTFSAMNATSLSVTVGNGGLQVDTHENATKAIKTLDAAIEAVSKERSKYGAIQNRLEYSISNTDNAAENIQSAESRIRDVDMAKEMMNYSKNNILMQASQSMLSQANSSTQSVLSLLQ